MMETWPDSLFGRPFNMTEPSMFVRSIRLSALSLAALFATASAQALTLPTSALVANSVQEFTQDNLDSFTTVNLVVEPRGTTYVDKAAPAGSETPLAFGFPITKIVIGATLNIQSGTASGSALYFNRLNDDTGARLGLTLANFTINYQSKQVLADTTPKGGITVKQMPLYNFTTNAPLALKYKFPLTIVLHEQLGSLKLTTQAKQALVQALELPDVAQAALDFDFGTLTQDVNAQFRARPVNATPYVAK